MIRYELYERAPFFEAKDMMAGVPDAKSIVVDSPFWGLPTDPRQASRVELAVVIDTNVLSSIRNAPQSQATLRLIDFARQHGLVVDPTFALMEQRVSHGNPDRALEHYRATLRDHFGMLISDDNARLMMQTLASVKPELEKNATLMRDYLVLVKRWWHSRLSFEEQIQGLARQITKESLPRFTFAFLYAATCFYAKHFPERFNPAAAEKMRGDMGISDDPTKEAARLLNLSHDLMLFMYCIETTRLPGVDGLRLSTIASADASFSSICKNIKCAMVDHVDNPAYDKLLRFGHFGLSPLGDFEKDSRDFVMQHVPQSKPNATPNEIHVRQENLSRLAATFFNGTKRS